MRKAFTLIELIIVLAIIGVLIVALLPVVTGAPGRARDAQRKVALNNIAAAIESFSSDRGKLPGNVEARHCLGSESATPAVNNGISAADFTALASYLKGGVPTDPQKRNTLCDSLTGSTGYYLYRAYTDGYLLAANMENLSQANYCTDDVDDFALPSRTDIEALIGPPPTSCSSPQIAYYLLVGG